MGGGGHPPRLVYLRVKTTLSENERNNKQKTMWKSIFFLPGTQSLRYPRYPSPAEWRTGLTRQCVSHLLYQLSILGLWHGRYQRGGRWVAGIFEVNFVFYSSAYGKNFVGGAEHNLPEWNLLVTDAQDDSFVTSSFLRHAVRARAFKIEQIFSVNWDEHF